MLTKIIILLLSINIIFFVYDASCNDKDIYTAFQSKVGEVDRSLFEDFKKNKSFNIKTIQNKVKPLFDEAMQNPTIWDREPDGKPSKFVTLLHPTLTMSEDIPSPYFGYVLVSFLNSKQFMDGGIELQQNTCLHLIGYLSNTVYSKNYKCQHKIILNNLFRYFNDNKYYNEDSISVIDRTILHHSEITPMPWPQYLLLLEISSKTHDTEVNRVLQRLADKCSNFNKKDLIPWLALIIVAKDGKEEYLNKLIGIVKNIDNSENGIKQATYMFPYLSMIQKPEIVELMKSFLNDEKIIDQGDDIINRYKGLSSLAAAVLYTILEGYEKFSTDNFDQKERVKCLDWFKNNHEYKFRKIDYFGKDAIISQMGYMIYYCN